MENSNVVRILRILFFCMCGLVVLGGLILFVMVLLGTIIGGESGSAMIVSGQNNVVPIYEWIMGIAVLLGIISMYMSKTYAYKMEKKSDEKKEK